MNNFRGIPKDRKQAGPDGYVYGNLLEQGPKSYICNQDIVPNRIFQFQKAYGEYVNAVSGLFSGLIEVQPDTVAQATGIEDKNGDMIYGSIEINGKMSKGGDGVKVVYCHLEREAAIYEIIYDSDVACFAFHQKNSHRFRYEFCNGHEFEIIGREAKT